MSYELSHDTIARQVYEKAGAEARTRRKVERFLEERYHAYQERGAKLTQDDVDYLWPFLEVVSSPVEELNFARDAVRKLRLQRRRRVMVISGIVLVGLLLLLWALFQQSAAQERAAQSRSMRTSFAARTALENGQVRLAYRLAEAVVTGYQEAVAITLGEEVLLEIQRNPLVRDLTHADTITAMQFSQDGELMLTASVDGELRLSDLYGNAQAVYTHDAGVIWASLALQDRAVVSLCRDGKLYLWNRTTGESQTLSVAETLHHAVLSSDGRSLSATARQSVYLWDLMKKTEPLRQWHLPALLSAAVVQSKDNQFTLIAALEDNRFGQWTESGQLSKAYPHLVDSAIINLALDAAQEKLIVQTLAGDFLLYASGDSLSQRTAMLFRAFQPRYTAPSASTDPERLLSISRDSHLVYVWNMGDDHSDIDLQWSPRGKVRFTALSQDGKRLVAGSTDNEVIVQQLKNDLTEQNVDLFRFSNQLAWGVFAPNHAHFLSSAGGREALLWKFDDSTYVANKRLISTEELLDYYQSRLRPLTPEERKVYQLNKL